MEKCLKKTLDELSVNSAKSWFEATDGNVGVRQPTIPMDDLLPKVGTNEWFERNGAPKRSVSPQSPEECQDLFIARIPSATVNFT